MEVTYNSGAQASQEQETQYPGFDFDGAAAEGYTKTQMVNHAWEAGKVKFDLPAARKAGYTDDEIYEEMYKRGNKSSQQAYDIDSIEPGAPDDEYEQLTSEGTIEVGKPSIIELPDQSINVDSQTTIPMQSMSVYGEQGEFSSIVAGKDKFSQEQAIITEAEKRDQASDWYIDPVSGQRAASKAISGEAEPTWDILFGPAGKLGAFGILQPGASADLANAGIEGTSKLATKTVQMVDDYLAKSRLSGLAGDASGLSKEARIILGRHSNNPEITEDLVVQVLQGVPSKDQAYILSRFLGEQNYIKQAVNGGGDAVAAALRADLTRGKAKIQGAIGNVDVPAAMAKYGDMMTMVEREGTQNVRAANGIAEKVNQLLQETYLIPDRGQQTALRLKGALERNGNRMSLLDALEYRPEINELLRKARNHNERANLKEIKDQLDDFIGTLATTEQKTQIDEAISTYANTMQNKEAMEIIAKHTDARGIGVDWTKVHRDLAEAGLRSPEAVDALRIAEAFANKFGNDKALVSMALPHGSSFDAGGVLGISGEIANFFKNHFALWGNRAENIKIQKAIMNTLKNSKTNYDFVDNLKANKAVPPEFTEGLDKILQIPYKPGARTTGDVNLEPIVTPVGGTTKVEKPTVVEQAKAAIASNPGVVEDYLPGNIANKLYDAKLLDDNGNLVGNPSGSINAINRLLKAGKVSEAEAKQALEAIDNFNSTKPTVVEASTDIENYRDLGDTLPHDLLPLEQGKSVTINGKTFDQYHVYFDEDAYPLVSPELYQAWRSSLGKPNTTQATARATRDIPDDARIVDGGDGFYYIESFPYDGSVVHGNSARDLNILKSNARSEYGRDIPFVPKDAIGAEVVNQAKSISNIEGVNQPEHGTIRQPEQPTVESLQQLYDDAVRSVRRLERIRVADRTPAEVQQLADLRANRLQAQRALQRATVQMSPADKMVNSFKGSNNEITIRGNPNQGRFDLHFNGNRIPMTVGRNGAVHLNTTAFSEGSGQGQQFYKAFYNALDAAGLKHRLTGLTPINEMRLPINLYKHKLDTGNLPLEGGQAKLQQLMNRAITRLNSKLGDMNFTNVAKLTDAELEDAARTTGPMQGIHAGVNSLKLYRKAAQILASGGTLSLAILMPYIDKAYEEEGGN